MMDIKPQNVLVYALLVILMCLQVEGVELKNKESNSFNQRKYKSPEGFECYGCDAGEHVVKHCEEDLQKSICEKCPSGTFSHTAGKKCQDCQTCKIDMIESSPCNATNDRVCVCPIDKELKPLAGTEAICVQKIQQSTHGTVAEQTTSKSTTKRPDCLSGFFWNHTNNRCEDRNKNTTTKVEDTTNSILIYILVPIAVLVFVIIILVIDYRFRKFIFKQRSKERSINYIPCLANENPTKDNPSVNIPIPEP